jgi:hypothetical protein
MKKRIIGLIGAVLLLGCGGAQKEEAAGADSGERAPVSTMVRPRAEYELRCSGGQLQITEIAKLNYAAKGCGAEAVYVCVGSMGMYACKRDGEIRGALPESNPAAAALAPVAVEGAPVATIVVPRAANDLGCAPESLAIYEIAAKTYVARGCNAERTYVCVGSMGMYQCESN